ncbi:MAG: hypothetical protein WC898_02295 [Candidatus Paceibacterota bacterium]|jgi:hypothetical protein
MKTYCTTKIVNGEEYVGRRIKAKSFAEAEKKAKKLGIKVRGELAIY